MEMGYQSVVIFVTLYVAISMTLSLYSGFWLANRVTRRRIQEAEERSRRLIADAEKRAERILREAEIEGRERIHDRATAAEERWRERTKRLDELEAKLESRDETLKTEQRRIEGLREQLEQRGESLEDARQSFIDKRDTLRERLSNVAQLSPEEAKETLLQELDGTLQHQKAERLIAYRKQLETESRLQAERLLCEAMERSAAPLARDNSTSRVDLPDERMKGRIVGRDGRNLRAFEEATGVSLEIDQIPEAVLISCHNAKRRAVAQLALQSLISHGKIHPGSIEDAVYKATQEIEGEALAKGTEACSDLSLNSVDEELRRHLGYLHYRSSYGQNVLAHSIEVAHFMATLAEEAKLSREEAIRAGLFHDLGKGMSSERMRPHAMLSGELLRRAGEAAEVIHAVEAHHSDVEPQSLLAHFLRAADALSAGRLGARKDSTQRHLERIQELEALALTHEGVEEAFAIRAGSELRVFVRPEEVDDEECVLLAHDLAEEANHQLHFSKPLKVTVLRSFRAEVEAGAGSAEHDGGNIDDEESQALAS